VWSWLGCCICFSRFTFFHDEKKLNFWVSFSFIKSSLSFVLALYYDQSRMGDIRTTFNYKASSKGRNQIFKDTWYTIHQCNTDDAGQAMVNGWRVEACTDGSSSTYSVLLYVKKANSNKGREAESNQLETYQSFQCNKYQGQKTVCRYKSWRNMNLPTDRP